MSTEDVTAEQDELKAAIAAGLRKCRVEDAPVSLIKEHDLFHVTHMVADALADLLAARDQLVRAEALREAADEMVGKHGTNPHARFLRTRADWIEADA